MFYDRQPYVPVSQRRRLAALEASRLARAGRRIAPVVVTGREIAQTFWGKAWCDNLERYSDYANRLPRGRTYVRNGAVIDLQIGPGRVTALVSGSEIYEVEILVSPVPAARWRAVCRDCTGAIGSLVELLQGRLSQAVMQRLCQERTGLFPAPSEIELACSCPDAASMCKHVAAVLYGVGARLDSRPELLFALRRADEKDLIGRAGASVPGARRTPAPHKRLEHPDLSELFGIELGRAAPRPRRAGTAPRRPRRPRR